MSLGSVLVLNPNRSEAQYISGMLKAQKWSTILSFDAAKALDMIRSNRFQLLILEAYVEGVNIIGELDKIKSDAPSTPIAIMTDGEWSRKSLATLIQSAKEAGADFTLSKPFSKDHLKAVLDETAKYHRERRTEHHVLVIEDNEPLRNQVCQVLKQVGYQVSAAANMEDAFFDHNISLLNVIVTSILIPGIGGIEGIIQIRKDWPHVKIVAMSQGVDEKVTAMHVLAAAKAAGAGVLLPKPFIMPDLLQAVATVLKPKADDQA